mgnify:CR=1 FL=1
MLADKRNSVLDSIGLREVFESLGQLESRSFSISEGIRRQSYELVNSLTSESSSFYGIKFNCITFRPVKFLLKV